MFAIASSAPDYSRLDYVSRKRSDMSHFRDAYPLDYTLSRPPTPSILRRTAVVALDIRVPRFVRFLLDLSFDVIIIPWDR